MAVVGGIGSLFGLLILFVMENDIHLFYGAAFFLAGTTIFLSGLAKALGGSTPRPPVIFRQDTPHTAPPTPVYNAQSNPASRPAYSAAPKAQPAARPASNGSATAPGAARSSDEWPKSFFGKHLPAPTDNCTTHVSENDSYIAVDIEELTVDEMVGYCDKLSSLNGTEFVFPADFEDGKEAFVKGLVYSHEPLTVSIYYRGDLFKKITKKPSFTMTVKPFARR